MAACQCIGCEGHPAWLAAKKAEAEADLRAKTDRFEAWLAQPPSERAAWLEAQKQKEAATPSK